MLFSLSLGIKENEFSSDVKMVRREAIRGIVIKNNLILMVHSNKGDYKFPGGGVNKDETYEETLKREIEEETGYKATKIKEKIGEIIERKFDDYEVGAVFEMKSTYYLCDVSDEKSEQNLDDYELEQNFRPVWITINEVLNINKKEIVTESNSKNPWLERETMVLEKLNEFVSQKKEKQYNLDFERM